ncbi:helix-turn-helix domain-containing protein [Mumia sp. zg.B17]|uniref:helix-turn-helix domain-containing protein n=1 Tax=Mumia sp. zg.B17 TaxID=2855446 RepID=UPI001C6E4103|nr:RodZ domain-containing protein [Mumia sp. zg.B17]MBW9205449.1 helix-turn-helix domain-containing protein [Mumia sp. zg.B17]
MTDHLEEERAAAEPIGGAVMREEVLEVRRSAGALAMVAVGAAALAILYGVRAVGGSPVLALIVLVLAAIAVVAGAAWWDARSPLLVADGLGVRFRHDREWRGLPWGEVDHVVLVEPSGLLRDGALEVVARDGTAYVVPLGLAVRVSDADIAQALIALSGDEHLLVRQAPQPEPDAREGEAEPAEPEPDEPSAREAEAAPRPAPVPQSDVHREPPEVAGHDVPRTASSSPLDGGPSAPARIDLGLVQSAGSSALAPGFRVVTALRASGGRPELVIDRPIEESARADTAGRADPVTEVAPATERVPEIDAPAPPGPGAEPAEPVLGTMLREARGRAGVSIDDLAARTQIRPHVIEALEDGDTGVCGGDFYARGHLRAIARVLGTDATPLVEAYDASYAQGPVPARAVFEAERSTGGQTIRVARGGRSWVALTVVVLVLAIIWGIGQLVVGGEGDAPPAAVPTDAAPAPADPSALAGLGAPTTNHLVIRGKERKPTKVTVTDARGTTVWSGELARSEFRRVSVVGPAKVSLGRADAATVAVNGGKARHLEEGSGKVSATLGRS